MPVLLPVGTVLRSRYKLIEFISQGGMGAVYKAEDLILEGRTCAVKEMWSDASAPGDLEHPAPPHVRSEDGHEDGGGEKGQVGTRLVDRERPTFLTGSATGVVATLDGRCLKRMRASAEPLASRPPGSISSRMKGTLLAGWVRIGFKSDGKTISLISYVPDDQPHCCGAWPHKHRQDPLRD